MRWKMCSSTSNPVRIRHGNVSFGRRKMFSTYSSLTYLQLVLVFIVLFCIVVFRINIMRAFDLFVSPFKT